MTKNFRTLNRKFKKQSRRKSRKMRKSMRGGNRRFVEEITRCIPQDSEKYPDIPISNSGYIENDDDWTKLAMNIYELGPIDFICDNKRAKIYGKFYRHIPFTYETKMGKLYGIIGNSDPVLLWRNGTQQTYMPPSRIPTTQLPNRESSTSYPAQ